MSIAIFLVIYLKRVQFFKMYLFIFLEGAEIQVNFKV